MTAPLISLENEIWKPVVGYERLYEISNMGRLKSLRRNKLMTACTNRLGYAQTSLSVNGVLKNFKFHRLVMEAFVGPIPNGMATDHINGNRMDARLENLEYVTTSENVIRAYGKNKHHHIKQHNDKLWYIRVVINGKRVQEYAHSLEEAVVKRDKIFSDNKKRLPIFKKEATCSGL